MVRIVGVVLLGLVVQACAMAATIDRDEAFFAALFDGPKVAGGGGSGGGVSCRQLRGDLKAEIEGIRSAQKRADDDFIAEQSAPPPAVPPRRFARKDNSMAPLKDLARRTKHAEAMNQTLQARGCRTVNIEEALKAPAQGQ